MSFICPIVISSSECANLFIELEESAALLSLSTNRKKEMNMWKMMVMIKIKALICPTKIILGERGKKKN
jgi:hypothetical protein